MCLAAVEEPRECTEQAVAVRRYADALIVIKREV